MKYNNLLILSILSLSLLLNACSLESDPAPKCSTKAITYQEFKDNYKPEKKPFDKNDKQTQNFLFDGETRGTEATKNDHYAGSAFTNQQIKQAETTETVMQYNRK